MGVSSVMNGINCLHHSKFFELMASWRYSFPTDELTRRLDWASEYLVANGSRVISILTASRCSSPSTATVMFAPIMRTEGCQSDTTILADGPTTTLREIDRRWPDALSLGVIRVTSC